MNRSSRCSTSPLLFASALAVVTCLIAALPVRAEQVRLFVSSRAGDRIAAKPGIELRPAAPETRPTFRIDEATRHQTIAGFGASFLEAGLVCLNSLPPDAQEGASGPSLTRRPGPASPP